MCRLQESEKVMNDKELVKQWRANNPLHEFHDLALVKYEDNTTGIYYLFADEVKMKFENDGISYYVDNILCTIDRGDDVYDMNDVIRSDLEPDNDFIEWWNEYNKDLLPYEGYQDSIALGWPYLRYCSMTGGEMSVKRFRILFNKMILKVCSINGLKYGEGVNDG
jgi:hypothetical protein